MIAAGPLQSEIEEAKRRPNGWLYRIAPHFGAHERIPPEAVIGAWKVDAEGVITGEFILNQKYDPVRWPTEIPERR